MLLRVFSLFICEFTFIVQNILKVSSLFCELIEISGFAPLCILSVRKYKILKLGWYRVYPRPFLGRGYFLF